MLLVLVAEPALGGRPTLGYHRLLRTCRGVYRRRRCATRSTPARAGSGRSLTGEGSRFDRDAGTVGQRHLECDTAVIACPSPIGRRHVSASPRTSSARPRAATTRATSSSGAGGGSSGAVASHPCWADRWIAASNFAVPPYRARLSRRAASGLRVTQSEIVTRCPVTQVRTSSAASELGSFSHGRHTSRRLRQVAPAWPALARARR